MRLSELEAVVESLLFISGEALSLGDIAKTIELDKATTKAIIHTLMDKYEKEKRGLRIISLDNSYQMCTATECFEYIRNMYKSPNRQGLSQSLLETLAIIAYKQPITKGQIEDVRGVSADHAVNKLVEKNLVCEVGRMDTPGKPILFGTSKDFLRYFGFQNISELPALKEATPVIIENESETEEV
ncbi:SMC-Scp complex subunit ScpB [Chakrabartyella piscis]|uniref:SMC-Scp complex subunit ScpB n=1 Tax=Chakrabartyella piscis TaxID=2918914 RepID=UPI002958A6DD|nr:SMC-Scp complex subunit ScpB [Chakrabartyella piscis]